MKKTAHISGRADFAKEAGESDVVDE